MDANARNLRLVGGRDHRGLHERAEPFLSPGSPIEPLGILSDRIGLNDPEIVVISAMGDAIKLGMNKLGKNHLIAVCADDQWLREEFPQYGKPVYEQQNGRWEVTAPPEVIGFNQIDASRALILACCMRGSLIICASHASQLLDGAGNVVWPRPNQGGA
jgi:hypothetical protein